MCSYFYFQPAAPCTTQAGLELTTLADFNIFQLLGKQLGARDLTKRTEALGWIPSAVRH